MTTDLKKPSHLLLKFKLSSDGKKQQDHIHKYLYLLHCSPTQQAREETRTDGYKINLSTKRMILKIHSSSSKQAFSQLNQPPQ